MTEPEATWSRLCGYRVSGPASCGSTDDLMAGELASRMWTLTTEDDRVQHIRVRPGPAEPAECRLDIGILLINESDDRARAVGARICTGALAAGPDTVGWTLQTLF